MVHEGCPKVARDQHPGADEAVPRKRGPVTWRVFFQGLGRTSSSRDRAVRFVVGSPWYVRRASVLPAAMSSTPVRHGMAAVVPPPGKGAVIFRTFVWLRSTMVALSQPMFASLPHRLSLGCGEFRTAWGFWKGPRTPPFADTALRTAVVAAHPCTVCTCAPVLPHPAVPLLGEACTNPHGASPAAQKAKSCRGAWSVL